MGPLPRGEVRTLTVYQCPVRAGRGAAALSFRSGTRKPPRRCAIGRRNWARRARSPSIGSVRATARSASSSAIRASPAASMSLDPSVLARRASGGTRPRASADAAGQLLWPTVFQSLRLGGTTPDLVFARDDPWPGARQVPSFLELAVAALRHRISLSAAARRATSNGMDPEPIISGQPRETTLARWFAPVLEHGAAWCAPNLETTLAFLRVDGIEVPLTVNEAEWDNSWICSPWTHYVTYAAEEIDRPTGPLTSAAVGALLGGLGAWFRRADLNRVVMVNNWLLSTNPWPRWEPRDLPGVLDALVARWPTTPSSSVRSTKRSAPPPARAGGGRGTHHPEPAGLVVRGRVRVGGAISGIPQGRQPPSSRRPRGRVLRGSRRG